MDKLNLEAWKRIGSPEYVYKWIQYGVKIPFGKQLPPPSEQPNRVHGASHCNFVDNEIKRLLELGYVCECFNWKPKCVLPLQVVPKKNGKNRLVLDGHYVNSYMDTPKFKQEGIEAVSQLIQEDDDLITADIKDGFHHVKVHISSQTYSGMCWRNKLYVWRVLPFGASCSPYFFNKIL